MTRNQIIDEIKQKTADAMRGHDRIEELNNLLVEYEFDESYSPIAKSIRVCTCSKDDRWFFKIYVIGIDDKPILTTASGSLSGLSFMDAVSYALNCLDDIEKKDTTFVQGERIRTLGELSEQEFVFMNGKLYHNGWFMSFQMRFCLNMIKVGNFRKALRIPKNQNEATQQMETIRNNINPSV